MPSTNHRAEIMTKALGLKSGQKAADLGSGNGLILIEMAKRGIEAHGYEINPVLVLQSRINIKKAGLSGKAFVHFKDFWNADLSSYHGVTIYLLPGTIKKLESKLKTELKPKTTVVTETWKFQDWKPSKIIENYVFVYLK